MLQIYNTGIHFTKVLTKGKKCFDFGSFILSYMSMVHRGWAKGETL